MKLTKNQVELLKVTKQLVGTVAAISSFVSDLQGFVLYSDMVPTEGDISELRRYRDELCDMRANLSMMASRALDSYEYSQKR